MHQVLLPLVHCRQVLICWSLAPQCAGEVVAIDQLLRRSVDLRVDDTAFAAVRVCLTDRSFKNLSIAHSSEVCLLPQSRMIAPGGPMWHSAGREPVARVSPPSLTAG